MKGTGSGGQLVQGLFGIQLTTKGDGRQGQPSCLAGKEGVAPFIDGVDFAINDLVIAGLIAEADDLGIGNGRRRNMAIDQLSPVVETQRIDALLVQMEPFGGDLRFETIEGALLQHGIGIAGGQDEGAAGCAGDLKGGNLQLTGMAGGQLQRPLFETEAFSPDDHQLIVALLADDVKISIQMAVKIGRSDGLRQWNVFQCQGQRDDVAHLHLCAIHFCIQVRSGRLRRGVVRCGMQNQR